MISAEKFALTDFIFDLQNFAILLSPFPSSIFKICHVITLSVTKVMQLSVRNIGGMLQSW